MKRSLRTGKVFIDWSQNNGAKTTVVALLAARPAATHRGGAPHLGRAGGSGPRPARVRRGAGSGSPTGPGPARRHGRPVTRGRRPADHLPQHAGPGQDPRAGAAHPAQSAGRATRSSSRSTTPGGCTTTSGWSTTASWSAGPCRRVHRPTPATTTSPCRPRTTRWSTRTFAGDIPQGEYGGGSVAIWDSGTYELHKWRDGKEVIVTLHGQPNGGLGGQVRSYALIHTGGGSGQPEKNWLMHLMTEKPAYGPRPAAARPPATICRSRPRCSRCSPPRPPRPRSRRARTSTRTR